MPKNSLCGLINNFSMQYNYLSRLFMSLCESVPVYGDGRSYNLSPVRKAAMAMLYVWSEVLCDLDGVVW